MTTVRPILLDTIGTVRAPDFNETVARIFVFGEMDGQPGFVTVYTAQGGKTVLAHLAPLISFDRSRMPRRQPAHAATIDAGTWEILKAGCGCGSPIRRMNSSQALKDVEAYLAEHPVAQPVAPGG